MKLKKVRQLLKQALVIFLLAFSIPAFSATNLLISKSSDRSSPFSLDGASLQDIVYIFISPDTGVAQVDFYLDSLPPASPRVTERKAPFDFNATAQDLTAKPFDTNSIPDGQHSVYAQVSYSNGTSEFVSAVFTVENAIPSLQFSQTSLSFATQEGSTTNQNQQVTLNSTSSGNESFTITDNANWLSVSPTSGTVPTNLSITVNPSGLGAGQYTGIIEASGSGIGSASMTVNLQILQSQSGNYQLMVSNNPDRSSATPLLGSTVNGIIYVFVPSQPEISRIDFYINNPQKSGSPFQTERKPPFDMAGTEKNDLAKPFDTSVLVDGSHSVTAVVTTSTGATAELSDFFSVANEIPQLTFSQQSLAGSRHIDNPEPLSSQVTLSSSDDSSINFSLSSNVSWLSATSNSGSTPATVTVTADPQGLSAGDYVGKISASASGYGTAQISYTLSITDGPSGILANPQSLSFSGLPDTQLSSQSLDITHSDGGSYSFTIGTSMPWLSVSTTSGTTPQTIQVSANTTGLDTGNYSAVLTITSSGSQSVDVPVGLAVNSTDKCAPVNCSEVRVSLPYQLSFTESQGYYPDKNGWGTGFTWLDQPSAGAGYIPDNLEMKFLEGKLNLTTTSGIQYIGNNSQDNALGVGFAAPNQVTSITTEILNIPAGSGNYEQGGLWFGNNEDNYIKWVALSSPKGPALHYLLEVNGAVVTNKDILLSTLPGKNLTLIMLVNPYDRSVSLRYKLDGGSELQSAVLNPPDEFFSFDAAGIDPQIGTRSFAGIFATHRNGSSPLTYQFNEFTLEDAGTGGGPISNVDFIRKSAPVDYPTSMVWGPDGRLYVAQLFGTIQALTYDDNMNVIATEEITALVDSLGPRLTLGITTAPYSTAQDVELWVASSSPSVDNGEPNSGIVTRLGGNGFTDVENVITGLPRAIANHSVNSLHFGDDNRLYIAVGGNTGAGAPNTANTEFGQMEEQPLSAAIVVADVFAAGFDGTCNNTSDIFGPPPCDVVPYATGLRNSYDFVFHSNGNMYATDNGLGVTGTYPPSPEPECFGFGSTASYLNGGHNPGVQPDLLLLIKQGRYYGHPNPHRDECVFKDGFYQGVAPLPNYEGPLYNLGDHKSSNAIIEYRGPQGCTADFLNGQLLITNYSVGDDVFRVRLNESGDAVIEGTPLATGFNDPLPMTMNPAGVIFVGEFGGQKVTSLQPVSLGCWLGLTSSPTPALDATGASANDKFFAVGGKNSAGYLNGVLIYDPATDSWAQGADFPGAGVENPAVVALNGKIYKFGGSTAPFSGAVKDSAVYTPATDSWTSLPDMPTARGGASAQSINGLIYVVGGMNEFGASLATVDVFNPSTNSWSSIVPMSTRRDNPATAAVDGKLYVIGGRTRNSDGSTINGTLNSVEMFDPGTGSWTAKASMPTGRRAAAVGSLNGRVQIMGGELDPNTPTGVYAQNEEYDPATNTWRALTSMPVPKHGPASATIGSGVYVFGGGTTSGSSSTSTIEVFRF